MKCGKLLLIEVAACLAAVLILSPVSHAGVPCPSDNERGHTGKKRLLLVAKNPSSWKIIKGGATGSMTYRERTGEFSFSAAGLAPRSRYALVRYADAPPAVEILTRGTSDERGRLELRGPWSNWTRKFWLVTGEDVEGKGSSGRLVNWRPDRYLFEEKQLGMACACPEPEVP